MTSPGILLCAVCCSYLIPESCSASPRPLCALKINLSWPNWLRLGLLNETLSQNFIFCTIFFFLKEQPLYAFMMGNLTEKVSLSSLTISNFPSTKISENSKKTPSILLTLSSGSLLLKVKFVFECALIHETHQRALSKGFRKRTWWWATALSGFAGISSEGGRAYWVFRLLQAFFGCLISWPGPSLRGDGNYLGFFLGWPPSLVIERVLDKSATPPRDTSSKFSKESRAVVIPKVRFFKVQSSSGLFLCDSTQRVMFCPKGVHSKPGLGLPREKSSQQLLGPSFPDLLPWNLQLESQCTRGLSQAASIPCKFPLWKWCVGVQFCVWWLWTDSGSPCDLW